MHELMIVVANPEGLHMRVAATVASAVQAHQSDVRIQCDGCPTANGCSILQLLMLGATSGTVLRVTADGPDAKQALLAVTEVFIDGGGI